MLRNQLLVAIRYLLRHKVYSAINIFGLAVGLAASATIFNWVRYEYSFDRHEKAGRIYRIIQETNNDDGGLTFSSGTSGRQTLTLAERFPEIEEVVRLWPKRVWVQYDDRGFDQVVCLADSSLLRVFTLPLVAGDPIVALAEPNGIIISRTMAAKFFGEKDPLGATLDLQDSRYFTGQYRVTGVMADTPPTTSHPFPFDCVFSTLPTPPIPRGIWNANWPYSGIQSFVLVRPRSNINALAKKVAEYVPDFVPEGEDSPWTLLLQPLDRVHLHSTTDYPNLQTEFVAGARYGNARTVYFLSSAAILILFVAGVNFVNLTTARATRRAREVGVRKAVGAPRQQLIRQYLTESVMMATLSGLLAAGLIQAVRPFFDLPAGMLETGDLPLFLLPAVVLVGLIAGCYPAFYLSAFDPVRVLKGSTLTGDSRSRIRGSLVLIQFAISIFLLIGTLTVTDQMRFILTRDLGFDREHIVLTDIFRRDPDRTLLRRYDVVKQELLKHPDVLAATGYKIRLGLGEQGPVGETWDSQPEGSGETLQMGSLVIDDDFLNTMGTRLLMGRNLDRPEDEFVTGVPGEPGGFDWDPQSIAILLNESAVRRLGWDKPLGRTVDFVNDRLQATVVGVVEDFHMGSLHDGIGPMFLYKHPQQYKGFMIRIRGQNIEKTMAFLNTTWDKFVPERSSDFAFLDDRINALYAADLRFSRLVGGFATLANIIACLGLVGLVAFAVEQRVKEVGIRRVLGASSQNIFRLFTDDFARLILIANVIAWPLGYVVMNRWLERFAYRIDLDWTLFATSGMIVLAVAILTMMYGGLRAAATEPTVALRNE